MLRRRAGYLRFAGHIFKVGIAGHHADFDKFVRGSSAHFARTGVDSTIRMTGPRPNALVGEVVAMMHFGSHEAGKDAEARRGDRGDDAALDKRSAGDVGSHFFELVYRT
jgi:hypothetical protein